MPEAIPCLAFRRFPNPMGYPNSLSGSSGDTNAKQARLFFGRSYYIHALYKQVTDPNGPSVILLHGQSGVGKSSLLDAGLLPRLEGQYEVVYIRRDQEKGLLGTFQEALGVFAKANSISGS